MSFSDMITAKVLATHKRKQAREKKEKMVIGIYIGLTVTALLTLFFLTSTRSYTLDLNLSIPDLTLYYRMAILILVISLISFGLYFIRPRIVQPTL